MKNINDETVNIYYIQCSDANATRLLEMVQSCGVKSVATIDAIVVLAPFNRNAADNWTKLTLRGIKFNPQYMPRKDSGRNNSRLLTKIGFQIYWNTDKKAAACNEAGNIDEDSTKLQHAYFVSTDAREGSELFSHIWWFSGPIDS